MIKSGAKIDTFFLGGYLGDGFFFAGWFITEGVFSGYCCSQVIFLSSDCDFKWSGLKRLVFHPISSFVG